MLINKNILKKSILTFFFLCLFISSALAEPPPNIPYIDGDLDGDNEYNVLGGEDYDPDDNPGKVLNGNYCKLYYRFIPFDGLYLCCDWYVPGGSQEFQRFEFTDKGLSPRKFWRIDIIGGSTVNVFWTENPSGIWNDVHELGWDEATGNHDSINSPEPHPIWEMRIPASEFSGQELMAGICPKYSGGSGIETDPYLISTPQDMNAIGADSSDWNKCFKLVADINMAAYSGTKYNVIGNLSNSFNGIFDGNSHVIRNLRLNVSVSNVGLFGYINRNAVVKNIKLHNIDFTATNYIGGIVAMNEGRIYNCHVTGTIHGQQTCGGIAGSSNGTGSPPDLKGEISNCSFSGTIIGTSRLGGIAGGSTGTIIINSFAVIDIAGNTQIGGVIGSDMGSHFDSCFAKGKLFCRQSDAGGFAGGLTGGCGYVTDIHNCHANVIVDCNIGAGGFSGSKPFSGGRITNSYACGKIIFDPANHSDIGGFTGRSAQPYEVINCFFLDGSGPDNGSGDPLTDIQMKQWTSFTNWDFTTPVWKICTGTNYPKLAWQQKLTGDFVCPDGIGFEDFTVLANQWLLAPDVPSADIAPPSGDGIVDFHDLKIFADNWLNID
ncbi:MAG: hypothetical protein A2Y10_07970 [Planctomycetes bacterium GWF2_41_51]|nr:MAG: hypothetical protein A2Y10_07970 [Planctomycetes bacterium GWF2_41_51]HBG26255.1 hypothetical protein [Phycisphaerales bacterium]